MTLPFRSVMFRTTQGLVTSGNVLPPPRPLDPPLVATVLVCGLTELGEGAGPKVRALVVLLPVLVDVLPLVTLEEPLPVLVLVPPLLLPEDPAPVGNV